MKIEPLFEVGNLIQHKYSTPPPDRRQAMEVIYITTETCSAGTQIFYMCRHLQAEKSFTNKWKEDLGFNWAVGHGMSTDKNTNGLNKYREDEIVPADEETIKIITGTKV